MRLLINEINDFFYNLFTILGMRPVRPIIQVIAVDPFDGTYYVRINGKLKTISSKEYNRLMHKYYTV